ncbi:hypothetical protein M3J07_004267 [Ascochyta lentis]
MYQPHSRASRDFLQRAEVIPALENAGTILGTDVKHILLWAAAPCKKTDECVFGDRSDFRFGILSRRRQALAAITIVVALVAAFAVVVCRTEAVFADQNAGAVSGTGVVHVFLRCSIPGGEFHTCFQNGGFRNGNVDVVGGENNRHTQVDA